MENNERNTEIKAVARKAGEITQKALNKANDIIVENQVKERFIQSYEEKTGRNASIDAKILKMSGMATAGAVAVSTMPAIAVGAAVGTALYATAQVKSNQMKEKYESLTNRSSQKDIDTVKKIAATGVQASKDMAEHFQIGMQNEKYRSEQERNAPPPYNNGRH